MNIKYSEAYFAEHRFYLANYGGIFFDSAIFIGTAAIACMRAFCAIWFFHHNTSDRNNNFFAIFSIVFINSLNWLYFAVGYIFFVCSVHVHNRYWNSCLFIAGSDSPVRMPKIFVHLFVSVCVHISLCYQNSFGANNMLQACCICQSRLMIEILWSNSSKFKSIEFSINRIQKCSVSWWKIDFQPIFIWWGPSANGMCSTLHLICRGR